MRLIEKFLKIITHGLPEKNQESYQHYVDAHKKMHNESIHEKIADHMYRTLSVIDAKTSSLLTFNSIIVAIYAVFIQNTQSIMEIITLLIIIILISISSFLALKTIWVVWSTPEQIKDMDKHLRDLMKVRRIRTIQYRLALLTSGIAFLSLLLYMSMNKIYREELPKNQIINKTEWNHNFY